MRLFQEIDVLNALEVGTQLWSDPLHLELFDIGLVNCKNNITDDDNLIIVNTRVTTDDAIDALSTHASLCSEACLTPEDPLVEEIQDDNMEVGILDETEAEEGVVKDAGVANLHPNQGNKLGLATLTDPATSRGEASANASSKEVLVLPRRPTGWRS